MIFRIITLSTVLVISSWTRLIESSIFSKIQEKVETQDHYVFYEQIFYQVDSILSSKGNSFWNYPLYGPLMIIDPETSIFIANQNSEDESFKKVGAVYTDTLPSSYPISNTAIDWDGKRWTMVMKPLPEDQIDRNTLIIHELYHGIQPAIGFDHISEPSNIHLDTYEGRVLLRLELAALLKALESKGNTRKMHLTHAFIFRLSRHAEFEVGMSENDLEINEGLAEYTGIMLGGRNDSQLEAYFKRNIDNFNHQRSFVRTFAYHTIPLYGYLLAQKQPNWHSAITSSTDLTQLLLENFDIQLPQRYAWDQLASQYDYNYEEISTAEKNIAHERQVEKENYKHMLVDSPTLALFFEKMNMAFDYRILIPLGDAGTIYPKITVNDTWGELVVEQGALIPPDWSSILVSQPTSIDEEWVQGEGWKLRLNDGWQVIADQNQYKLIRQ